MPKEKSVDRAFSIAYDRLNPHHLDSVHKASGYHELLRLLPMTADERVTIARCIEVKMAEVEERSGAFGFQLTPILKESVSFLRLAKP